MTKGALPRPWDGIISAEEQRAYSAAGFGRTSGLGSRPALLIIDVQYRTVGTTPKPFWEAIREFPTACGEVGWAAVHNIARLLGYFRERGWPVLYPHVSPKENFDYGRLSDKVPAIMTVAAGLVMWLHLPLPETVLRPISLLSDAALPLMILVLGMQLERATRPERASVVATAVALSICVTPAIGWGYAHLLGLTGPAFQAAVIQSSMPAAVVTTILALQYEVAPNFVTSVVAVSTLLSPFTLTWIIAMLHR